MTGSRFTRQICEVVPVDAVPSTGPRAQASWASPTTGRVRGTVEDNTALGAQKVGEAR
jgi:hypothetical protein